MGSVNKVILVGNLGRDIEVRYTQGGSAVGTMNMATTSVYKDRDGNKKEDTQWHRIVVWGKTCEALQDYLVKGKQVYVEGELVTRKWQDKDGNDKYSTEVKARNIVLLSGGGGGSRRSAAAEESQDFGGNDFGGDGGASGGDEQVQLAEEDIPF